MSGADRRDLDRASEALAAAMALVQRHAGSEIAVDYKHGGSPVTAVDREVDELLRTSLPTADEGWLSEESVDDAVRLQRSRVWVVDPIDGTRAFIAGRPDYAVSIALLVDGQPAVGAIGNPAIGMTVVGGPGLGVQVHGEPDWQWPEGSTRLRVLASRSEMRRGEWQRVAERADVRPVGSVAFKLALVAAGFADFTLTMHPKHEWDVAAGAALVHAAGGEVWLPRGGHLLWNRSRPRFLSFAAARAEGRAAAESLLRLGGE